MSKTLQANCVAGVVSVSGVPVPSAEILSEGVGQSDGVLILDQDKAFYLAKQSGDLKSTLEKVIEALEKVSEALAKTSEGLDGAASGLTSLDTAGFLNAAQAGVPSPPVATGDISSVNTAKAGVDTAKSELDIATGQLETLKEQLV